MCCGGGVSGRVKEGELGRGTDIVSTGVVVYGCAGAELGATSRGEKTCTLARTLTRIACVDRRHGQ